ncbi:MAG TPA: hypothetical protein VLR94_06890, partial [Acidobacteriota bacterium]|nr:hypothetical protein [Acidobacteriota bacterium]
MLKFGICTLAQLRAESDADVPWVKQKEVAIDLYNEVLELADADRLAERVLLRFMDERGVYKRTYTGRFQEFDEEALGIAMQTLPQDLPWIVHDHGVSDGRTATDFFQRLAAAKADVQYHALDYDPEVTLIRDGKIRVALGSRSRKMLQIVRPPFVFNMMNRDSYRRYPLNHPARLWVRAQAIKAVKKHEEGILPSAALLLFCPRARRLAAGDPRFHLMKHSILEPFRHALPARIVRVMNLLNPDGFTSAEMLTAVRNVHDSLDEKGLFLTGSNQQQSTTVDGAIYQKDGAGFRLIRQSGAGSPADPFIREMR